MTAGLSPSIVRAWARLIRAEQAVLGAVEAELTAQGFPPLAWYDVLLELERGDDAGLRPFELQKEILLEQYNLSRLIGRMAKAGLVRRAADAADGRGHRLTASPKGRELRRRMWPAYARAIERQVGSRITEAEAESLSRVLGKLIGRP